MAATKPGHLSKKNLKQYVEARKKKGETVAAAPKRQPEGSNRVKKSLSTRAKPKQSVLTRRRVRSRIAQGK